MASQNQAELKKEESSRSVEFSPASTIVAGEAPGPKSRSAPSALRKNLLLVVFCLSQFLDATNLSSLFSAIPTIASALDMTAGQSVWIISATQLTFAAFLLVSGRISDVYNPKHAFILGIFGLGVVTLGTGFVRNKIGLFVLRAISGIFASLTIPSSLNLIVKLFPEPLEQSRAISVFGASAATGNIIGIIIGAIFVQYANWYWVFWFTTIIAIPVAIASIFLIPPQHEPDLDADPKAMRMKGLDMVGVSILTIALILFVFALTSSSSSGWGTAMVIAPLIISVFMVAGFLYWETIISEDKAAVPPSMWFYPNFAVLFGSALLPYFWWVTIFLVFTTLWQDVYQWTAISTAVHMLPLGVTAFAMTFTGVLSRVINPKWIILTGQIMMIAATLLLPWANSEDRYWPILFPAFAVGSAGTMLAFVHTNIAIFRSTPPRMAGTVGAIFNSALQLGSAVGSAAVSSIETSVEAKPGDGGPNGYEGRAAAFWFLLAIVIVEAIAVLVFYRPTRTEHVESAGHETAVGSNMAENKEAQTV